VQELWRIRSANIGRGSRGFDRLHGNVPVIIRRLGSRSTMSRNAGCFYKGVIVGQWLGTFKQPQNGLRNEQFHCWADWSFYGVH